MDKIKQIKRPLSCNPLINFPKEDNFIYSEVKLMNEVLWKRKFSLRKLHEKWKRKVRTNFLDVDIKFSNFKSKNNKLNKIISFHCPNTKTYYDILQGGFKIDCQKIKKYNNNISINDKQEIIKDNILFNKIVRDDKTLNENNIYYIDKLKNKSKNIIKMKDINTTDKNEMKNIIITCNYYNGKYLERLKNIKSLVEEEVNKTIKYIQKKNEKILKINPELRESLIFKEMLKKNKTYLEYIEHKNFNNRTIIHSKIKKSNSSIDINSKNYKYKKKTENNIINDKIIFEKVYIINNYLRNNKLLLKEEKFESSIVDKYFELIKKEEFQRKNNKDYKDYINNYFNINKNQYKNSNEKESERNNFFFNKNKEIPIKIKKELHSSSKSSIRNNLGNNKANNIHFHPGTYYLFKENGNEYHAWSCCLNENKFSEGCCKKVEKMPVFNYDIIT